MKQVGDPIVYVDPKGVKHNALVTAVWDKQCINLIYVSGDPQREDSYGRQIERETSIVHAIIQTAPGNYWE